MSIDKSEIESVNDKMHERYVELAAMLKERFSGNSVTLKKVLAKFSLQEGVSLAKSKHYFKVLVDAGLIVKSHGKKLWTYNAKEEWELFHVDI
jgi:hypothetical protein